MASVMSAITNTVPITEFNRGLAGKIFDEVKQCGAKIVMKNSAAECVLIGSFHILILTDGLHTIVNSLSKISFDVHANYKDDLI